uniref:Uncharacterized protein n=1 Tax=Quercus lobata TaxID=97700 RepID=A0A7N2L4Y7_QUELO
MGTVRECIEGPLHKGEADIWVCDIHSNGMWELHKLTFIFPPLLSQSIKAMSIRTTSSGEDHLSWISSPRREFDSNNAYLIVYGANTNEECFRAQKFWAESNRPDDMHHTFGLEVMEWIKANACCTVLAKGKSYPWAHFFLFGIWPRSTIAVGWVKPPVNWVKLNMNSSTLGNPVLAGGEGLIRDCHGLAVA